MTDDRIDRLLRQSADDVRSRVAGPSIPPPMEDLDGGSARWGVVGAVLLVAVGIAGVALGVARSGEGALEATQTVVIDDAVVLCEDVAAITAELADPPTDVAGWQAVRGRLDLVVAAAPAVDLTEEERHRLDRFTLLAGLAATRGLVGQQFPASDLAHSAEALGSALLVQLQGDRCPVPAVGSTPVPGIPLPDNSLPGGS